MPLRVLVTVYDIGPVESKGSFRSGATDGWNLVEQLSRFCDVSVLTHSGNHEDILESLSHGALPQVKFHFVDPPPWQSRFQGQAGAREAILYFWEKRALQTARSLHEEKAFDAVHHLSPRFAYTPSLLSTALPVPSLWGPVTSEIRPPRNGAGAKQTSSDRLGGRLNWILQQTGAFRRLRHRGYPKTSALLLSDNAPEAVKSFPHEVKDRIFFFPGGGISKNRMVSAASLSESRGEFSVLAAGDFSVPDGYLLLIQAFFEFSRQHTSAELAVVGKGWQDERIGRLMRELSLGSHIELWDWMPRADLQEKLKQTHVFIAPDFDADTSSLCVDAMAAGVPVVTFRGSGAHVFVEEEWGVTIAWETPRQIVGDLKAALDRFASAPGLRSRMGRAALRNARENLVWELQGKNLESVYSQTLLQGENIRIARKGKGRFFY